MKKRMIYLAGILAVVSIMSGCTAVLDEGTEKLDYDKVEALADELREDVQPFLRETIGFGDVLVGD
jgi:hypothetical protein